MESKQLDMDLVRDFRVKLKKEKIDKYEKLENVVMGLDLSKFSTGIAFLNKDNDDLIYATKICPKGTNLNYITMDFCISLNYLIRKYKPSKVMMENVYLTMGGGFKSAFESLLRQHGIALAILSFRGLEFTYVHPSTAKSFVECKTKEDVFEYIKKKYKLINFNFEEHNDITDAILMALNHRNEKINEKPRKKKKSKKSTKKDK